jgi:hypothetical protein
MFFVELHCTPPGKWISRMAIQKDNDVIMVLEAGRTKTGNTRYEYISIVLGVGLPDHHQI